MTSVARTLTEGFEISPIFRPAALEDIMIGLIHTLATNGLLHEAISVIEKHYGIPYSGKISSLNGVASHPYIPFLYKSPEAVATLLKVLPYINTTDVHDVIDVPESLMSEDIRYSRRILSRSIDAINTADIGFKLYLPYKDPGRLGIIVCETREDLLTTLSTLDLQVTVQDKLLQ